MIATQPSARARQRAIFARMQDLAAHVPHGRDYERTADWSAAYDAHEATMAELEAEMEALNDAARAELREVLSIRLGLIP